jgi:LPXTG-motif cell wall-anchored protein
MKRAVLAGALVLGGLLIASPAQAETYVPGPVESTVTSVPAPPDLGEPAESKLPQTGADGRVMNALGAAGLLALIGGGTLLMYKRKEGAL